VCSSPSTTVSAECVGIPCGTRAPGPLRGARNRSVQGRASAFRWLRQGPSRGGLSVPSRPTDRNYMSDAFSGKKLKFPRHRKLALPSSGRPRGKRLPPERFIRTLKENLLWVRTFDTIRATSGERCSRFRETYKRHLADRTAWIHHARKPFGKKKTPSTRGRLPHSPLTRCLSTNCGRYKGNYLIDGTHFRKWESNAGTGRHYCFPRGP